MLWELQLKRFEENRGNRKLCHLNPLEFFDHTELHFGHAASGLVSCRRQGLDTLVHGYH